MNKYEEFKAELKALLQVYYRGKNEIEILENQNDAGLIISVFQIRTGEKERMVFNVNEIYLSYDSGEKSIEELAAEIIAQVNHNNNSVREISYWFQLRSEMMHTVFYSLINYEKNKEFLMDVPNLRFLDMAIILYMGVTSENDKYSSGIITNRLMEFWNTDFLELYEKAKYNSVTKQPAIIMTLEDTIRNRIKKLINIIPEDSFSLEESDDFLSLILSENTNSIPLYVVTNSVHRYGAACMLYPDILYNMSKELGSDLFIIPASIHDIILVPAISEIDGNKLQEIVNEVSGQEIEGDDWLSEKLYVFIRESNKILNYKE